MNIKQLVSKVLMVSFCVGAVPAYAAESFDLRGAESDNSDRIKFCRHCVGVM